MTELTDVCNFADDTAFRLKLDLDTADEDGNIFHYIKITLFEVIRLL